MSFVTDELVKASIVATLDEETNQLATGWNQAVADANAAAFTLIRQHWVKKGYTLAVVVLWDFGAEYQKAIAFFDALIRKKGDDPQAAEWSKQLDWWRAALADEETLMVNGEPAAIASSSSAIGHGRMTADGDYFKRPSSGCAKDIRW